MEDTSKCRYTIKENIGETVNYFPEAAMYGEYKNIPSRKISLQKIIGFAVITFMTVLLMIW